MDTSALFGAYSPRDNLVLRMPNTASIRAVFVSPRRDLGSPDAAFERCGVQPLTDWKPRYFSVPLVAIFIGPDGLPLWTPTLFLADVALKGRSVKGDTVRSYAEALIVWLRFLSTRGTGLEDADEQTFAVFRSELVHAPRRPNGRPYASSTANHRITVVANFHLWAQEEGVLRTRLGRFLAARAETNRGHNRLLPGVHQRRDSLAPLVMQRMPKVLSYDEIQRLFLVARQPYRLMFKWGLVTGMRRFEVCDLRLDQLPSPEKIAASRDGFVQVDILRKGSREVTVQVPVPLAEETNWYALADRPPPRETEQERVFLGPQGAPIDRSSLSREFRRCADILGTGATLHHLRHTFAVNVLTILERSESGDDPMNSIKTLQVLMGHASIESTEIYLRSIEASSDAVMEALSYLYGATL